MAGCGASDVSADLVLLERSGAVLVITLNRPAKRNAVDRRLADALSAALDLVDDDGDIGAAVLAAHGPVFCAGSDLTSGGDYVTARGGEYGIVRRARRKPLIAAVEGAALGGGLEILLACDLVVASTDASFGLPEVTRGLVPSCAGLFRGPRALPLNIARQLVLTGEPVDARRAYTVGLVNLLTRPGQARAEAVRCAERIASNGPVAVRACLSAINELESERDERGWSLTARAHAAVRESEDYQEGLAAFHDKRPARWRGR